GNLEDVCAEHANGWLQIAAGRSCYGENIAARIHESARWGVLLEHALHEGGACRPLRGQRRLYRAGRRAAGKGAMWQFEIDPRVVRYPFDTLEKMLFVDGLEEIGVSRCALGDAEEEVATGVEGIMEPGENPFLHVPLEVHQQVTARDEIEPGKR